MTQQNTGTPRAERAVGSAEREEPRRVLVVIGTRPEAIKMIPVIRALQESGRFRPVVVSTGQHAAMLEQLIQRSHLRLDANLRAGEHRDGLAPSLNEMVARVITGIDRIWRENAVPADLSADGTRRPKGALACLVHGDTSSAAAAALAAFNLQIPVVHVEAGLRTSNLLEPFPEEGNRQLISRVAALHFAPTTRNKTNLVREGIDFDRIVVTGNTAIDMLHWAIGQPSGYGEGLECLEGFEPGPGRRIVLVTAHRRENWGAGIDGIAEAVRRLSERYPESQFVVPLHPNPVARRPMRAALTGQGNVRLVEPRDYFEFVHLIAASALIITDSGGLQEEAPAVGVPVLVTRETTERQEGVLAGSLTLVGTDPGRIVSEAVRILDRAPGAPEDAPRNPYGDGRAAERIVRSLDHVLLDGAAPEQYDGDQLRSAVRRFMGDRGFEERG
ncbi:UDP-N-acetylglucosamine 2-epimerase (non-hydrolyzing) [Leucobacter weissii]|uniref:UDP-N-acetylglucosamine 2-epimerase (non-hydrolyzing) n=1 Tax=Leucobacter weissii TaxID=1983706 RepID=A0A939MHV7_9MICO|nr:UDP-N-acetylglucosamine 2-epimerase (non-hydrolyzing) [Leucobacter weissii]MBO1900886.1 UDP-N-acetylglucosamine 2-epimerase (non-hydrolyzing) [Leucobacter weissii]